MTKKIKRITAAIMAATMAISMAVYANAACSHTVAIKRRTGESSHYSSGHTVEYRDSAGYLASEYCSISATVYSVSYVCNSCGKIVSSAGYETVESHSNSHCTLYPSVTK